MDEILSTTTLSRPRDLPEEKKITPAFLLHEQILQPASAEVISRLAREGLIGKGRPTNTYDEVLLPLSRIQKIIEKLRPRPNSRKEDSPSQFYQLQYFMSENPRYQLLRLIARGGIGEIYQGIDLKKPEHSQANVAIKTVKYASSQKLRDLELEAKTQAKLVHPNIPQIFDYIQEGGTGFIIMEYLDPKEWQPLDEVIAKHIDTQTVIELYDMLTILDQYTEAISYLKKMGIQHRDLKPRNIMVRTPFHFENEGHGESKTKVIDFGISNWALDLDDKIIGANIYFSPEALNSEPQTPRTDVYATALIVYELFTGQHFFEYHSPGDADGLRALFQSRKEMVPPEKNVTLVKSLIKYGIPPEKQLLFLKMMTQALDPNPEKRYADVPTFIKVLHLILDLVPQKKDANKRN